MGENAGRLGSLSLVSRFLFYVYRPSGFERLRDHACFFRSALSVNSRSICSPPGEFHLAKLRLIEFAARRRLLRTHAARDNFRLRVIFAANRSAGEAAQHGELAHVRE